MSGQVGVKDITSPDLLDELVNDGFSFNKGLVDETSTYALSDQ